MAAAVKEGAQALLLVKASLDMHVARAVLEGDEVIDCSLDVEQPTVVAGTRDDEAATPAIIRRPGPITYVTCQFVIRHREKEQPESAKPSLQECDHTWRGPPFGGPIYKCFRTAGHDGLHVRDMAADPVFKDPVICRCGWFKERVGACAACGAPC